MTDDLYKILGVTDDASQQAIDAAFQEKQGALAKDLHAGNPEAESQLRMLTMAHKILGDPITRKAYTKIRQQKPTRQESQKSAENALPMPTNVNGNTATSEQNPRPSGVLNSFFKGKYVFTKVFLLGVVVPFVVLGMIGVPRVIHEAKVLWYVAVGVVLFRSTAKSTSRFARWGARALSILIVSWNSVLLLGMVVAYGSGKISAPIALQTDNDPGCLSVENALLNALIPPRAGELQKEKDFLNAPEGRFLDAALKGKLDDVKALLDQGVDINTQDKRQQFYGNNAMHHAARTNNVELATLLLERGMNVDAPGPTGYSALHVASGLGKLKMARFLIDKGAKLSQFDTLSSGTPLDIAIIQGRAKTVELLLQKGALKNVEAGRQHPLRAMISASSICPSHAQIVQTFIEAGADLNAKDVGGTPLFLELASRNSDVAMVIIKHGKGIDWTTPISTRGVVGSIPQPPVVSLACSNGGTRAAQYLLAEAPNHQILKQAASGAWGTPLNCAIGSKYDLEFFRFLLDQGFDPNAKGQNGKTPLHRGLDADVVELLASRGSNVSARDNEGKTPLHYRNNDMMVAKLVEHGADVNMVDNHGRTPIFEDGDWSKTQYLLAHGARLDVRDEDGRTPLLYRLSHRDVYPVLLNAFVDKGIDIRAQDNTGATAVHYAAQRSEPGITIKLLTLYSDGAKVKDANARTPLHYAANNPFEGIAEVLVKNGADINAQDKDGNTPLHLAATQDKRNFVSEAIKLGAKLTIKNKDGQKPIDLVTKDSSLKVTLSGT